MSKLDEIVKRWVAEGGNFDENEPIDWPKILRRELNVADDDPDVDRLITVLRMLAVIHMNDGFTVLDLPLIFFYSGLGFARIRLDVEEGTL